MADEDQEKSQPSLELPKLFGRKKRPDPEPTAEPDLEPTEVLEVDEPTQVIEPEPPAPKPVPKAAPKPEPKPEPKAEPEPKPAAKVLPAEAGAPLFADEKGQSAPAEVREPQAPKPAREPLAPKLRESLSGLPRPSAANLPPLSGYVAAAVTGVVIGLMMVALTAGSLETCEVVRGTSSCGGAGIWFLIAILVAMILLGGSLLRLFGVPDPGSSSFLAVGLVAVIALLFLIEVILSWWMVLVIPAVSAATYVLSHWVTTAFVEPAKERDPSETQRRVTRN
jgi:hypothetical protein